MTIHSSFICNPKLDTTSVSVSERINSNNKLQELHTEQ